MCDFNQVTSRAGGFYSTWAGMPLARPCRCTSVRPLAFNGIWVATSLSMVLEGMDVEFDVALSPASVTWFADFDPSPARCLACSCSLLWVKYTHCPDYVTINWTFNNTCVNEPRMSKPVIGRPSMVIHRHRIRSKLCYIWWQIKHP